MNQTKDSLEPATRIFVEKINRESDTPVYKLSPKDACKVLYDLQAAEVAKLPADIENLTIPVGSEGQVSIRIIRSAGNKEILPVVMYFHGAGWILGDKDTHDRLVREIAKGANAAVVFVNLTLSPEAKYSVQIEEAYAATKYIAENGKEFNLDTSRLAVAGDSVGGNVAAAVSLLAKERGGPKIVYQVLFYPVTDTNFGAPSYRKYSTDIWLTREAMKCFWDNYFSEKEARRQPTAFPLKASDDQLKGQPPALLIIDENDVSRNAVEAYTHKLMQAGVDVVTVRYLGTIHDFVMLNLLGGTPAACSAIGLANENLRNIFSRS
ncbi:TPA: alpha/beta hydrolase [Methanosarcina acetivorans]|uniref:Triacylglycerol lipase n=2 Tax=Methanosarcina acetivorans TaxID=2214 RepID=Q8TMM7_METAC|nr:alpha/beta hydrolase [Methanosarcina acetivorans]AAM06007.1 triacylglycerol lipase [Methanosarcina acetivorans C2A]HIH95045.1 alpha/beta hydrolase [Methanosarcina acetivorans]